MGRSHGALAPILPAFGLLMLLAGCVGDSARGGIGYGAYDGEELLEHSQYYSHSAGLRRAPPLHERGIKRLGVLYVTNGKLALTHIGLTIFENDLIVVDEATTVPKSQAEALLLDKINGSPYVSARPLTEPESRFINFRSSLGYEIHELTDDSDAILGALHAEGIDAVLVVWEQLLTDFLPPTDIVLSAKGILSRPIWGRYAYAGFRFFLIDPETGEPMERSMFYQLSAKRMPGLPWHDSFEGYSEGQRKAIVEAVRTRIEHNITLMLQLLKILRAEDGEYLSYDPEKEKPPPGYYPE